MRKRLWIAITAALWLAWLFTRGDRCEPAWFDFAIDVERCPDGNVRPTAELAVHGARRGASSAVDFRVTAHYTTGDLDGDQRAPVHGAEVVETWLTPARGGARTPVAVAWRDADDARAGQLTLPPVPDGTYQLHARYVSPLGPGEVTAPLALFTPARIHVITDRPLYQPGDTVRFRAVALRARDLVPLDQRPGTWVVRAPDGETLLEEAAPAGDWGVVAGSFPLDKAAASGTWKVGWKSADALDEVAFTVQPFSLPRFRVEAAAGQAFYQPGDAPSVTGAVTYSSGSPVAGAALDVAWSVDGAWPPPTDWLTTALPRHAVTAANGRFTLALPAVPADLQGAATLTARIAAVDPAGDRVEGAASVLLSQDGIAASLVTELGDGLVEAFNNRLYLRVTRPDGRVVASTKVVVSRAWQTDAPPIEADLDEDGVASLQLDPGTPVNIVVPAAPWRPAPPRPVVSRGEPRELIAGRGASLGDQVALDQWLAKLAPCAIHGPAQIRIGVRVGAGGGVVAASAGGSPLERCAASVIQGLRLPAGGERLYALPLAFVDPPLPTVGVAIDSALDEPAGLAAALGELARGARGCLPAEPGELPSVLGWRAHAASRDVELTGWIADPSATGRPAALACVMAHVPRARIALAEPAPADAIGVARFTVGVPDRADSPRPQPTTMLGYELAISVPGLERQPSTRLRVAPGQVPDLRLRVTPVLARPGEPLTAELIRGPRRTGTLPDKLALDCLQQRAEQALDADHRASFTLAKDVTGWCTVSGGGVQARVYVPSPAALAVSVTPGRARYAPGDTAELAIQTTLGGRGGPAAVSLLGVDDSLGQLVALPGADAFARVLPAVETRAPAFGVLDGQALALGRIRGANAAAATVLRVSAVPAPAALDAVVSSEGATAFDPVGELTDHFYPVLAELEARERAWEAQTSPLKTKAARPPKMTPATMARLWNAALDACAARGLDIHDAYGHRLALWRLPADLLALVDPRAVVVDATRLPEDVENWPAWVAKEKP